jgi:hypothetical protein
VTDVAQNVVQDAIFDSDNLLISDFEVIADSVGTRDCLSFAADGVLGAGTGAVLVELWPGW